MAVGGIRAERMDPADAAWLHTDRPANLMVVNTVLWFDAPVDQASVLEVFGDRVVSRFRRFRQRAADPALTLAPWAAPEWVDDAGFVLADHVSRTRLPAPGDQRALQRATSDLAGRPLRKELEDVSWMVGCRPDAWRPGRSGAGGRVPARHHPASQASAGAQAPERRGGARQCVPGRRAQQGAASRHVRAQPRRHTE